MSLEYPRVCLALFRVRPSKVHRSRGIAGTIKILSAGVATYHGMLVSGLAVEYTVTHLRYGVSRLIITSSALCGV